MKNAEQVRPIDAVDHTLPEGWALLPLEDLCCKPQYGYTETAVSEPIGPKFLRITDIQDGRVDWTTVPYCRCDDDSKRKHLLAPGDLLIARIGATTGKSFYIAECPESVFASYLIRLRPKNIDGRFLYYFFQSEYYWAQINAGKGEKLKGGVSGGSLVDIEVRVPPLPQRTRITEILYRLERAVRNQEDIVRRLAELQKSVTAKLLHEGLHSEPLKQEDIGEMPTSWDVVTMEQVVSIAEGQADPRRSPYRAMTHIGPENVEEGTGRLLPCNTAEELGLISGKYLFKRDDIVYSKIRPYLKKAVVAQGEGLCSADMYPLSVKPGFDIHFTHALLLSDLFTDQAVSQQDRTGIPKLNRNQLNSIMVCKPSPEEQREIGAIWKMLTRRYELAVRQLEASRHLFASTLHELITGSLELTAVPEVENA